MVWAYNSSVVENSEISCGSCVGACCQAGTRMPLNTQEARFMVESGANLVGIFPADDGFNWSEVVSTWYVGQRSDRPNEDWAEIRDDERLVIGEAVRYLRKGIGMYLLSQDCPFLVEREDPQMRWQCMIHEDPRRPRVCLTFVPGSVPCVEIRKSHGVDPS